MRETGAHREWGGRDYRAEEQRGERIRENKSGDLQRISSCSSTDIWSFHACQKVFNISETNASRFRGSSPHNSVKVGNSFICIKVESFMCVLNCFSCVQLCATLRTVDPHGAFVHGNSPGKNAGVGCHALLQGGGGSSLGGKLHGPWVINRVLRRVFPKQWCKFSSRNCPNQTVLNISLNKA